MIIYYNQYLKIINIYSFIIYLFNNKIIHIINHKNNLRLRLIYIQKKLYYYSLNNKSKIIYKSFDKIRNIQDIIYSSNFILYKIIFKDYYLNLFKFFD